MGLLRRFGIFLLVVVCNSFGQNQNAYVSEIDKNLTIKTVGILLVTDNVNGIYIRPVTEKLNELLKATPRFGVVEIPSANTKVNLEYYQDNSKPVADLCIKNKVDALIGVKIHKTPKSIEYVFDLFMGFDGKVLVEEKAEKPSQSTVQDVIKSSEFLFNKLISKIPYQGRVLSRSGERVTIDLGTRDGIKNGSLLTTEQIISLSRHPRFNFMLSAERIVLGKIRLVKVEDAISFGMITQERSPGVIVVDSKINGLDFVSYSDPAEQIGGGQLNKSNNQSPATDKVSFGKNPKEWVPTKQPSFGRVDFFLGLGSMRVSRSVTDSGGVGRSASSDSALFPQIGIGGEVWFTPNWFMGGQFRQGVLKLTNNRDNSTPSLLNAQLSHYDMHFGYKLLLQDDFWGPQISAALGFSKHELFVDNSTPSAYTRTSYRGLYYALAGSMPLFENRDAYLQLRFTRHLNPGMDETPSSGTSDNTITVFSFGGMYRYKGDFWIKASLDLDFYSSTFTGTGTDDSGLTSSQNGAVLYGGVSYMF